VPKQPLFGQDLEQARLESLAPAWMMGIYGLESILAYKYGILKSIGTIVRKLNIRYKPLGVAVFLAVGGLLFGALVIPKTGVIKQSVTLSGSSFIPEAQGAEIDSAALTVSDAPFLASANTDVLSSTSAQGIEVFYGDGAMEDPISSR
jgi:cytochrome c biogenesis protein ResB